MIKNYTKLIFLLIAVFTLSFAHSQATLVKDINEGPEGSNYGKIYSFGNELLVIADDGKHGYELWISDGTDNGTTLLKDINPGTDDSEIEILSIQSTVVYFSAKDGEHGRELWTTDGTSEGTKMILDIVKGDEDGVNSFTGSLFYDNKLLFQSTANSTQSLWSTDGTANGTVKIKDFCSFCNSTGIEKMVQFKDEVYFITLNELYKTDGTKDGTEIVFDNKDDDAFKVLEDIVSIGDLMYLAVGNWRTKYQSEPWVSDGTKEGTKLLMDIKIDGASSPHQFLSYKGEVYFIADKYIYKTDGTTSGTKIVTPVSASSFVQDEAFLNVYGDKLYFIYSNNLAQGHLSVFDGDTSNIESIALVSNSSNGNYNEYANGGSGQLFFNGPDTSQFSPGVYNQEIYITDGTKENTRQIVDINPGRNGAEAFELMVLNNYLYFFADDGTNGDELWKYKIDSTTSIDHSNSINNSQSFTLSPNPAFDFVELETKSSNLIGKSLQISIYSNNGQLINSFQSKLSSTKIRINTNGFNLGLYHIKLATDTDIEVLSFIKN